MLASGFGHINLVLTGLMPVTLLLADDLVTGRRDPWPGGAAVGLAMAAQLFTSEELLFQTALVLLVAVVLVLVTQPRAVTAAALGRIGRESAAALGVFGFVSAGALWLQFWGPLHQYGNPFTVGYFETDVRAFYVPSHLLWLTTRGSSAFAASYVPGAPEYLAYLGIPLLVTAPLVGIARIGDLRTRLLLGIGAVFALFSLGGTLLDNGRYTAVRLPWGAVQGWPVFGSALPDRFAIVVALAAAGLLAVGTGWLLGTGRPAARLLAVLLAAACVVPLLPRPYPATGADPIPPFFPAAARWLTPGSTVLVLPYPTDTQTVPLVWQAAARMAFQMPGGYFIGPAGGGPRLCRRPRADRGRHHADRDPAGPPRLRRSPRRCGQASGGTCRTGAPGPSWPGRAPAPPLRGSSRRSCSARRCAPAGCCSGGGCARPLRIPLRMAGVAQCGPG